ncbi:MAG: sigma-70 family RNA polymerase sigma factor [Planctomycetota bacterium]
MQQPVLRQGEAPIPELQRQEFREMLLRELEGNERQVVEEYYFRGNSLKEIAQDLGVTSSRVSEICAGAMARLRKRFSAFCKSRTGS